MTIRARLQSTTAPDGKAGWSGGGEKAAVMSAVAA